MLAAPPSLLPLSPPPLPPHEQGKPSPLVSSFRLSYYTLLNLMRRSEEAESRMEHVIKNSFQQFQQERNVPQVHEVPCRACACWPYAYVCVRMRVPDALHPSARARVVLRTCVRVRACMPCIGARVSSYVRACVCAHACLVSARACRLPYVRACARMHALYRRACVRACVRACPVWAAPYARTRAGTCVCARAFAYPALCICAPTRVHTLLGAAARLLRGAAARE